MAIQEEQGVTETSLLNFVLSDGHSVIATRYVWPQDRPAASLYYAEGRCGHPGAGVVGDGGRGVGEGNRGDQWSWGGGEGRGGED